MSKSYLLSSCVFVFALTFGIIGVAQAQEYEPAPARSAAMNTEMRLSAVEDQMRALTGKVEQNDFVLRRMDQAIQRIQSDYDARLAKLESVPPAVIPPAPVAAPPVAAPPEPTPEPAPATKTKTDKVPEKPADNGLSAQEQYDRAFSFLKQANYGEAEKAFKGFIDKNGKDKMIDNAKYWYAETFYLPMRFSKIRRAQKRRIHC